MFPPTLILSLLSSLLAVQASDPTAAHSHQQRVQWKTHEQNLDASRSPKQPNAQWNIAGSAIQIDEKYDPYTNTDTKFKIKLTQTPKPYAQRANKEQQGTLWRNNTNHLTEWETTTAVSIYNSNEGTMTVPNSVQTNAINNGFALWYSQNKLNTGPFYGTEGVWTGLGIFMDSYVDRTGDTLRPKIYAILNDGKTNYAGVDASKSATVLGSCSLWFRNNNNTSNEYPIHVKVGNHDRTITVSVDTTGTGKYFEPCLATPGIRLPTKMHFGMSASSAPEPILADEISVHKFEVDDIQYHTVPDPVDEGEKPYVHEWTINDIGDQLEHTENAVFNMGDSINEVLQIVTQLHTEQSTHKPITTNTPTEKSTPSGNDDYSRQTLSLLATDVKNLKSSMDSLHSKLDALSSQKAQDPPSRDTDRLLSQLISRFETFAKRDQNNIGKDIPAHGFSLSSVILIVAAVLLLTGAAVYFRSTGSQQPKKFI